MNQGGQDDWKFTYHNHHAALSGAGDFDLVCFGELLWDVYEDHRHPGGAPFNVAAIAGLLQLKSVMITAVGDDQIGRELLEAIRESKLVMLAQVNSKPTGTARVFLDSNREPGFIIAADRAYDHIEFDQVLAGAGSRARYLCFGTLAQRNPHSRSTLLRILQSTAATRIYDFNYREGIEDWEGIFFNSLPHTDILKLNLAELARVKEACVRMRVEAYLAEADEGPADDLENDWARSGRLYSMSLPDEMLLKYLLKEYDLRYIIVTRGAQGASLYSTQGKIEIEALPVEVVDTTGCGDAFTAGIIYGMARRFSTHAMLKSAINLASQIAATRGAVPDRLG